MKNKYWDIFLLILSIYVVIELGYEIIYPIAESAIAIINTLDFIICIIFLSDFFFFLTKAENKRKYIRIHWLDFLSSLPFMTVFRVFRLARIMRMVRLLRGVKGLIPIVKLLGTNKLQNILISYILVLLFVMLYCSFAFYSFEKDVNSSVHVFFDAFWWAFITTTTVGYGDIFPVTTEGRIVSMVLAIMGMGLFSIITAELAATFYKITQETKNNDYEK